MTRIGLIGYGYWGPNLARNFFEMVQARLVACCDLRQDRLDVLSLKYPDVTCTSHPEDMISDPDINAIVIATPVSTHYELARSALQAGKHVLIEKPMTTNTIQADDLIDIAKKVIWY